MSTSWDNYDNRVCQFPLPHLRLGEKKRDVGIYLSGGLFALGWWFFIDAVAYSSTIEGKEVDITFADWISGITSTLGMIIVNSIDKSRLTADDFTHSGSGVAWKARLFLFIGFAMMAGGLAGSVTVLILKYIIPDIEMPCLYFGIAEVIQNSTIMLSSVVLWIAENTENNEYYAL
ncbi:hypothetical protein G9A89_000733 [Geosiphon pyriformis]|nr:hypothetical protein G9A89_000733 [Geosiphon pyriformis]